ncbi:MAG: OmpA/MotB family protein [Myxococcota bacterium]
MSDSRDFATTEAFKKPFLPLGARWPLVAVTGVLALLAGLFFVRARSQSLAAQALLAQLHEAEDARRALDEQVALLSEDKKNLLAHAAALNEDLDKAESELQALQSTYDTLAEQMKAEIAKGDIHLTQSQGQVQLDLSDKVLFDVGEAELSKRGQEVLLRLAAGLARVDEAQAIQVAGHTDDSPISERLAPKYPSNWELSVARAVNVVRFLSDKGRVPPERMVAAGYGKFHPVATNATHEGRARNRRIEVRLTPSLEGTPGNRSRAKAPKPAVKPVSKKGRKK